MLDEKYKSLSSDAKIIWSILYELQITFYHAGWVENDSGKVYFYHPQRFIDETKVCDSITIRDLLKELHDFQLLSFEKTEIPKLFKYYLIKPDSNNQTLYLQIGEKHEKLVKKMNNYIHTYEEKKAEEQEEAMTPELIRKKNGDLLKDFIRNHNLEHDDLISELYNECILKNPQKMLSMDYISEAFQNIINAGNIVEGSRKPRKIVEEIKHDPRINALQFMQGSQRVFRPDYLNSNFDENTQLILYKHFDLASNLQHLGLLSLPILSALRVKFQLTSETFNMLLDQAFTLYDTKSKEPIMFHDFFEKIVENQYIFKREQKLREQVSNKLFDLPEHLRDFAYKELKKALEHFPKRYELIVNNLRVINTVYQEQNGMLPDSIFEKAFRRLFMKEHEIYNVNSYFRNAIKWIQEEINRPKPADNPVVADEKEEDKTYTKEEMLTKIVKIKDTEGAIEKMSSKDKEEYFRKAEELKKRLEELE